MGGDSSRDFDANPSSATRTLGWGNRTNIEVKRTHIRMEVIGSLIEYKLEMLFVFKNDEEGLLFICPTTKLVTLGRISLTIYNSNFEPESRIETDVIKKDDKDKNVVIKDRRVHREDAGRDGVGEEIDKNTFALNIKSLKRDSKVLLEINVYEQLEIFPSILSSQRNFEVRMSSVINEIVRSCLKLETQQKDITRMQLFYERNPEFQIKFKISNRVKWVKSTTHTIENPDPKDSDFMLISEYFGEKTKWNSIFIPLLNFQDPLECSDDQPIYRYELKRRYKDNETVEAENAMAYGLSVRVAFPSTKGDVSITLGQEHKNQYIFYFLVDMRSALGNNKHRELVIHMIEKMPRDTWFNVYLCYGRKNEQEDRLGPDLLLANEDNVKKAVKLVMDAEYAGSGTFNTEVKEIYKSYPKHKAEKKIIETYVMIFTGEDVNNKEEFSADVRRMKYEDDYQDVIFNIFSFEDHKTVKFKEFEDVAVDTSGVYYSIKSLAQVKEMLKQDKPFEKLKLNRHKISIQSITGAEVRYIHPILQDFIVENDREWELSLLIDKITGDKIEITYNFNSLAAEMLHTGTIVVDVPEQKSSIPHSYSHSKVIGHRIARTLTEIGLDLEKVDEKDPKDKLKNCFREFVKAKSTSAQSRDSSSNYNLTNPFSLNPDFSSKADLKEKLKSEITKIGYVLQILTPHTEFVTSFKKPVPVQNNQPPQPVNPLRLEPNPIQQSIINNSSQIEKINKDVLFEEVITEPLERITENQPPIQSLPQAPTETTRPVLESEFSKLLSLANPEGFFEDGEEVKKVVSEVISGFNSNNLKLSRDPLERDLMINSMMLKKLQAAGTSSFIDQSEIDRAQSGPISRIMAIKKIRMSRPAQETTPSNTEETPLMKEIDRMASNIEKKDDQNQVYQQAIAALDKMALKSFEFCGLKYETGKYDFSGNTFMKEYFRTVVEALRQFESISMFIKHYIEVSYNDNSSACRHLQKLLGLSKHNFGSDALGKSLKPDDRYFLAFALVLVQRTQIRDFVTFVDERFSSFKDADNGAPVNSDFQSPVQLSKESQYMREAIQFAKELFIRKQKHHEIIAIIDAVYLYFAFVGENNRPDYGRVVERCFELRKLDVKKYAQANPPQQNGVEEVEKKTDDATLVYISRRMLKENKNFISLVWGLQETYSEYWKRLKNYYSKPYTVSNLNQLIGFLTADSKIKYDEKIALLEKLNELNPKNQQPNQPHRSS